MAHCYRMKSKFTAEFKDFIISKNNISYQKVDGLLTLCYLPNLESFLIKTENYLQYIRMKYKTKYTGHELPQEANPPGKYIFFQIS